MPVKSNNGMDVKALTAGVAGGGGLATLVVSLVMSNMTTGIKSVQVEMAASTKALQAENKIALEQIKHMNLRMNSYEEISSKKADRVEEKIDKALDIFRENVADRYTKDDHENYARKISNELASRYTSSNTRFNRVEEKINRLEEKIINLKTNNNNKGE